MAYFVQIAEDVEAYVYGVEGLTAGRRQEVLDACSHDLAANADHFLQRYPLAHESYSFEYEYAFIDGGVIYTFRFVVDGANMSMGVVSVVYADHEVTPIG